MVDDGPCYKKLLKLAKGVDDVALLTLVTEIPPTQNWSDLP